LHKKNIAYEDNKAEIQRNIEQRLTKLSNNMTADRMFDAEQLANAWRQKY
jgi:hypothetical protein